MKFEFRTSPFIHVVIDQFYDDQQYDNVWRELMFLYPKFLPPSETGSAQIDGRPQKRGYGMFLQEVYKKTEYSDIENITKLILFSDRFKSLASNHSNSIDSLIFKYYSIMDYRTSLILLQHYVNGDYYKPHKDESLLTSITVLHSKSKKYKGGELFFPEFDYEVDIQNNQTLIFPSILLHEVKEVKMNSNNPEEGRFSISLFGRPA